MSHFIKCEIEMCAACQHSLFIINHFVTKEIQLSTQTTKQTKQKKSSRNSFIWMKLIIDFFQSVCWGVCFHQLSPIKSISGAVVFFNVLMTEMYLVSSLSRAQLWIRRASKDFAWTANTFISVISLKYLSTINISAGSSEGNRWMIGNELESESKQCRKIARI